VKSPPKVVEVQRNKTSGSTTYLTGKLEGDRSMLLKRAVTEIVVGQAPQDPRNMMKAILLKL
jgi:hypothetical protein